MVCVLVRLRIGERTSIGSHLWQGGEGTSGTREPRVLDKMRSQQEMVVTPPLLDTKLYVPRSRRGLVPRPRLSERLDRGAASKLMLVSAPAGFGKTTLLAEWLTAATADGWSSAWLSLDQRDNDPALFWTYLVAALRKAEPGVGGGVLSLLQSPQPPSEAILATLLNDLSGISNDVVLVLDDYHVIDAGDVQDGMTFLLEHLPAQVHLVIASRADPALALARLRGRGELVEIRAADLRFTPDEAAAYLNEVMGLQLRAQDVAALEGRTEGWIAALQLAALSMQGRDDVAGFIAGFAGDDRYIVDYLVEEVLQCQPEHVRSFLLQTSILDRLARLSWRRWSEGTCSWSRWTTVAGGIAITSYSLTFCGRICWTSSPKTFLTCTGKPARGTRRTASRPRRSTTPWPPRTSLERRTCSSERFRRCVGAGSSARCVAGSRRFPTSWSASGQCSALGMPGRCWLTARPRALRTDCGTPSSS
jgi:hypothetical protein